MITQINQTEVILILSEYFDFKMKFRNGLFYRKDHQEDIVVMWSQSTLIDHLSSQTIENIVSLGLPIFSKKKNLLHLYPQFINCMVEEYENYVLEDKLVIEVSFGNSIKLENPDGICYLSNILGNKVAFGKITNHVFHPLIDLGWYLRDGS